MLFAVKSSAWLVWLGAALLLFPPPTAGAKTAAATISSISATGVGGPLGTVSFMDSTHGLMITPKLSGLPPGKHGFHIHDKGDCGPARNQGKPAARLSAAGHSDPAPAEHHMR